jgi:hypothetical protein
MVPCDSSGSAMGGLAVNSRRHATTSAIQTCNSRYGGPLALVAENGGMHVCM